MIWTLLVALALGPALLNPRAAAQVTVDELPVDCNSSSESFQDRVDRFLRQLESKRPPLSDIRGLEVRLINSSGLDSKLPKPFLVKNGSVQFDTIQILSTQSVETHELYLAYEVYISSHPQGSNTLGTRCDFVACSNGTNSNQLEFLQTPSGLPPAIGLDPRKFTLTAPCPLKGTYMVQVWLLCTSIEYSFAVSIIFPLTCTPSYANNSNPWKFTVLVAVGGALLLIMSICLILLLIVRWRCGKLAFGRRFNFQQDQHSPVVSRSNT